MIISWNQEWDIFQSGVFFISSPELPKIILTRQPFYHQSASPTSRLPLPELARIIHRGKCEHVWCTCGITPQTQSSTHKYTIAHQSSENNLYGDVCISIKWTIFQYSKHFKGYKCHNVAEEMPLICSILFPQVLQAISCWLDSFSLCYNLPTFC